MSDVLIKLRSHHLILNAIAGALGGGVGSVLAELVNALQPRYQDGVQNVGFTGLWSALFTSVIAAALFAAGVWHQRRDLSPHVSSIVFQHGHIEHIETSSGKRTPLEDGIRLRIGPLNLVVHAVK